MIRKIISGGQTGADRAALDVAIELGIPYGGWVPRGRKTEDSPLSERYNLQEMPTVSYPARTEANVVDAHGTLIITHGKLTTGSAHTKKMALKHNRPCLHVNLRKANPFKAAEQIHAWIKENRIKVLNVTGSSARQDPAIYGAVVKVLKAALYLETIDADMPDPGRHLPHVPATVNDAVDQLVSQLPLKDRALIARMAEYELSELHFSMGNFIIDKFGLREGDSELIRSCRKLDQKFDLFVEGASAVIIRELWKRLRETHLMRVVK